MMSNSVATWLHTIMMTFKEYIAMREGLWLADKNAVPGMSRINTLPGPRSRYRERPHLRPATPPKVKPLFKSPAIGTFKPKKIKGPLGIL